MGVFAMIAELVKKVVEFYTAIEEVYVPSSVGEELVVNKEYEKEINETIKAVENALNQLKRSVNSHENDAIDSVKKTFETIRSGLEDGSMNIVVAKKMLSSAIEDLKDAKSLTVENPEIQGQGGAFGTVTYKGESGEDKKVGGVIVPREGKEKEEIGGTYISEEEATQIIEDLNNQLGMINIKPLTKRAEKETIRNIREFGDQIAASCDGAARSLPNKLKGRKVSSKTDFKGLKRLVNTLVAFGWLFTALGKKVDYRIRTLDDTNRQFETVEKIDSESSNLVSNINEMEFVDFNRINEVFATGNEEKYGLTGKNAEIQARKDGIEYGDKRAELTKAKEDAINRFNSKTNHTNAERLEFEIELLKINKQVMELQNDGNEKTIEYSIDWINLNDEHIASGELYDWAIEEHEVENDNSRVLIEGEKRATAQNIEIIEIIDRKIELYEKMAQRKDVEQIVDVENVAETVFEFLESDLGKKIGLDNFLEFMDDKNIELFTSYSEFSQAKDVDEFMDVFALLNNTFGEYVSYYCEGDLSRVDTDQYAQFFEEALHNEEKIGKQGIIGTAQALMNQNNLNRVFYEQKGKELAGTDIKTGIWQRFTKNVSSIFDKQRAEKYNEVIKEIEADRNINSKSNEEKNPLSGDGMELTEEER